MKCATQLNNKIKLALKSLNSWHLIEQIRFHLVSASETYPSLTLAQFLHRKRFLEPGVNTECVSLHLTDLPIMINCVLSQWTMHVKLFFLFIYFLNLASTL